MTSALKTMHHYQQILLPRGDLKVISLIFQWDRNGLKRSFQQDGNEQPFMATQV